MIWRRWYTRVVGRCGVARVSEVVKSDRAPLSQLLTFSLWPASLLFVASIQRWTVRSSPPPC
jgi:hypothetical protein